MSHDLGSGGDHLGATPLADGSTRFVVWAPLAELVEVVLVDGDRVERLELAEHGYHRGRFEDVGTGDRYRYRLHRPGEDPVERNDPASRWQPDGLHGPSAVDDPTAFAWSDDGWRAPPLRDQIVYELHVGTFTAEGTFEAIVDHLDDLKRVGVTTIELMPIWQFPGDRNWGYDGVLPYAVQHSYGGPDGLRRLVDAAHAHGIGVWLDVVYNHYGPEGNHLPDFGPYLTDRYDTPWGQAVNVDGAGSDAVRRYVTENAARWVRDFHIDGLRLDAVHAIIDTSAVHLLEDIASVVHTEADRMGRRAHVIAESELADPRLVRPTELGGYGLDGQWLDDIHHALHGALTGESEGYLADQEGLRDIGRALNDRYVHAGRYSEHRERTVGRPAPDVPYERFVICTQNHDQVGNRMLGDRQSSLLDLESLKLSATALYLLPFTPMLWMGQEYGERNPFQYFIAHTDPELVAAVQRGRKREFAYFADHGEPPDPADPATFERCKLDRSVRDHGDHAVLWSVYRELARLRREIPAIAGHEAGDATPVLHGPGTLSFTRAAAAPHGDALALVVLHAGDDPIDVQLPANASWDLAFDSAASDFDGPGGTELAEVKGDRSSLRLPGRAAALLTGTS